MSTGSICLGSSKGTAAEPVKQSGAAAAGNKFEFVCVAEDSYAIKAGAAPAPLLPPVFGFGTWKISDDICASLVYDAIKAGVRHIDCASCYGNEKLVGEGIKRALQEGICSRGDLWVTSKLWNTYHARQHVRPALLHTLSDLQLDYLDLYLVHYPVALRFVPFEVRYPPGWTYEPMAPKPMIEPARVPMSETWAAMEALVDEGLVRSIGVSNVGYQLLADMLSYCRIKPSVNQVECHPYFNQTSLIKHCKSEGVQVVAYSPLGSSSYVTLGLDHGLGKGVLEDSVVKDIAAARGKSAAQVVLRWNIQRGVSVLAKSSTAARIAENFSIFDFELFAEEMRAIDGLHKNLRFCDAGELLKDAGGDILPIFS